MFLMHYIFPFIVQKISNVKDKVILYGLLLGNIIDLDHIYLRLTGKISWFESACHLGMGSQCSFGVYPLHSFFVLAICMVSATYSRKKNLSKWVYWISLGIMIHLILDLIHFKTGFGF